jgi:hypothetical protein
MKREILCSQCADRMAELFPKMPDAGHPGEYVMLKRGKALFDMRCDGCISGTEIREGDSCAALSIYCDYDGIPYFEWEHENIEVTP